MGILGTGRALAFGLAVGLAMGFAGRAVGRSPEWRGGDHYETGWTVLVAGKPVCANPFIRPAEREIECRTVSSPP
jgi:hypothetical protein